MKQLRNAKRNWNLKRNSFTPFYLRWMAYHEPTRMTEILKYPNVLLYNFFLRLRLQHRLYMVLNLSKTDNQEFWNLQYAVHNTVHRVKNHLLFFLGADPLGAFRHRSTRDLPPIFSLPGTEIKYCTLIKKKSKFSSYIGNFRWDRV